MARSISVEILGDSSSLVNAFRRSSRAAHGWNSDLSRASRGALVATVGFRGLGRSIAFASGAFVGGAGLTAALKASIEGFDSYQESLQRAVGLGNIAQKQVAGFSKQILALGTTVGKSPQELANAFYLIASSGIAASKAMGVLRSAAKLSIAGLGDTGTVVDALTSVLNAYRGTNLNAAKAADVLAATVREGKGEAASFAPVIGNVVALSAKLGVSFDQVGAALAAQTRLGTDAETTAIQLQRVFSTLLKVTPKSAKAFASVGLNADKLREALGTKNGLIKVLLAVKQAFGTNDKALAQAFGDVRALRGILNLVGRQVGETTKVFDRMTHSTGSAKRAFNAISKTTEQQFRRMRASAQVAGVAIGAVFAPVAATIAGQLSKAANAVSTFFQKLDTKKTLKEKLKFTLEGAENIGRNLQRQLDKINFDAVGQKIGAGIAAAVKFAIPATKELVGKINQAISSIDWNKVGRAIGPGLAAAVVTAFVTLTDPAFWAKNWDLALAVALTVFGDGVGKIAGSLAKDLVRPLARFAPEAGVALAKGFRGLIPKIAKGFEELGIKLAAEVGRIAPATADLLLSAWERVPGRLLRGPIRAVQAVFSRLGKKTQFLVKVLGLKVAIDAIVGFAKKVIQVFTNLPHVISAIFSNLWKQLKIAALRAVIAIIEPFTHIPRKLGGGTFQDLQKQWKITLDSMTTQTKVAVTGMQAIFDGLTAPNLFEHGLGGATTPRPTAKGGLDAQKKGADNLQKQVDALLKSMGNVGGEGKLKKAKAKFEKLMNALSFKAEVAEGTKNLNDDIAAQKAIQAAILAEIKIEGKTTDLLRALFESRQKVIQLQQQQQDQIQFKALGLTAEGDQKLAGNKTLLKRVKNLRELVKGTPLDTKKTTSELNRISRVLQGQFGKVGREVRQAIVDMLNEIQGGLDGSAKGPLTKTRGLATGQIVKGLGLDPEQIRELRSRLSGFNTAGIANAGTPSSRRGGRGDGFVGGQGVFLTATSDVILDGQKVGKVVTKVQQKRGRRNPAQRRGPNRHR